MQRFGRDVTRQLTHRRGHGSAIPVFDQAVDPASLRPEERLSAVAAILACGFLRLQPTRLQRLRSAAEKSATPAESDSYSLDGERIESVHASVNQA